ncbi:hemin uptake protein HemP [Hyphomicrobium sp.]|uniref:hemin uptake protein HemP n=1 Tax=Hyphomicrobium sp. TaxID=82 RepID=UPI002FDE3E79
MSDRKDGAGLGNVRPRIGGTGVVRYAVSELMRGGREAILEHNGSEYHLRITANGRLILTK